MVTGNEDHDQNVVGHLCMSEPKKKERQQTRKNQSSNSLELLPKVDRFAAQTRHHRNSGRGDRPRMGGHSIGTRPLRRGEKKRALCNSQQVIHFALYILPEDPTDFSLSFLFFFQKAMVTASGIVRHIIKR